MDRAPRSELSRFANKFSDQELLAIVADVARVADPSNPGRVTQSAYDEARAVADHADTPRARKIAARFKCSWSEVLRLGMEARNPAKILAARGAWRIRDNLTKAEIAHYMRRAASALESDRLGVADYERVRGQLVEADRRRYAHRQKIESWMPSANTIIGSAGSWENALVWAGLLGNRGSPDPLYPAGLALDDFIADYGFAPLLKDLREYQNRRGLGMGSVGNDYRAWRQEQLESGAASRHGPVRAVVHPAQEPDGWRGKPSSPAPEGWRKNRRAEPTTLDECMRDLAVALELSHGESLTMGLYRRLAVEHGLLSASTIHMAGKKAGGITWAQLRDRVVAERARRRRRQPRK